MFEIGIYSVERFITFLSGRCCDIGFLINWQTWDISGIAIPEDVIGKILWGRIPHKNGEVSHIIIRVESDKVAFVNTEKCKEYCLHFEGYVDADHLVRLMLSKERADYYARCKE